MTDHPSKLPPQGRLRAASPEMYRALEAIQKWLMFDKSLTDPKGVWNEDFVKANNLAVAALAKARGEP